MLLITCGNHQSCDNGPTTCRGKSVQPSGHSFMGLQIYLNEILCPDFPVHFQTADFRDAGTQSSVLSFKIQTFTNKGSQLCCEVVVSLRNFTTTWHKDTGIPIRRSPFWQSPLCITAAAAAPLLFDFCHGKIIFSLLLGDICWVCFFPEPP